MIGGLQTFYPTSGAPVFAVMVIMRQFGFEGPDHRWLAVAGRL
jgi:predicted secreted protein